MSSDKQERQGVQWIIPCLFFASFLFIFQQIAPGYLFGFSGAEVYGHAWTHSWRMLDFPHNFQGTDLTIGTRNFPAIDIIPSIISYLFGYNFLVIGSVLLAACAGYYLSLEEEGNPWIGAAVLCFSPLFLSSIHSGLTEDMGIGLLVFALLFIKRYSVWGSVFLLLTAFSGLVLAWFGGILAIAVSLRGLYTEKERRVQNFQKIIAMGAFALVGILPLLWLHWERLTHKGHRFGHFFTEHEPFWALNPWKQVDLASFLHAGTVDFSAEIFRLHPSYLGLSALVISLFARSRFWWSIFVFFFFLSLGPSIHIQGLNSGIPNPILNIVQLIPGYSLLNHHGRALLPLLIAFSVLVAKGAKYLESKISSLFLFLIVLLDLCLFSPIGAILPVVQIPSDPILQEIEVGEGYLLRLPMVGEGISFQEALLEQTIHKQALFLNPNRPGLDVLSPKHSANSWIEDIGFPDRSLSVDICIPPRIDAILVTKEYVQRVEGLLGEASRTSQNYSLWEKKALRNIRSCD